MKTKRKITKVSPPPEFQVGQIWVMGEDRLQIGMVGRWLVHYRHFKGLNTKRVPTRFTGKVELGKMLAEHKAILVQE